MKLITILFAVLYTSNSIFIISSHAVQNNLQPEFNWFTNQKDARGKILQPDESFMTIASIIQVLDHILQEKTTENHWLFASQNYPNLKTLRIQRTNPSNEETTLATYTIAIPADGKSHRDTSIWGFFPFKTTSTNIGLNPYTAMHLSSLFAKYNTQTSSVLMPIVHCIMSGQLAYYKPKLPTTQEIVPFDDNRYAAAQASATKPNLLNKL